MAPKKTNKLPTGERPKQLSKTAKTIKKAAANPSRASGLKAEKITPREAARRAGVERDRMNRKTNTAVFNSKTSTSYSPKRMSANDERAAGFRGATTQYQINLKKKDAADAKAKLKKELKPIKSESRSKAGSSVVSKVVKRAKTTAREARDIATAVGTVGNAAYNTIYLDKNPLNITKTSKKNLSGSVKNLVKQVKETRTAAKTGAKGTTSAKSGGRGTGYKFTTKSGGTFQERKLKPGTKRK
jgi:hypothetical protein